MLRIEKDRNGSVNRLRLIGRIESDLIASIRSAMSNGGAHKSLDLSEVTFIDSSGLGALIASLKVIGDDGEIALCGAREAVANMFKLTRMNKVFRMFSVPEDAAAALF